MTGTRTDRHDRPFGWGWWRHKPDRSDVVDARERLREARELSGRLMQRRNENGFGDEIATALRVGKH